MGSTTGPDSVHLFLTHANSGLCAFSIGSFLLPLSVARIGCSACAGVSVASSWSCIIRRANAQPVQSVCLSEPTSLKSEGWSAKFSKCSSSSSSSNSRSSSNKCSRLAAFKTAADDAMATQSLLAALDKMQLMSVHPNCSNS